MTFDPSGFDLQDLLSQAQAMQEQLEAAQAELAQKTVTGSAGGNLVIATVSGTGELVGLQIDASVCDPSDTETLADLVVAAVRDANHQAIALAQAVMPALPEMPEIDF